MILSLFKVAGHSMEPTLREGTMVVSSSLPYIIRKPRIGDMVLFINNNKMLVKRVVNIKDNKLLVEGDNKKDSLNPGWIGMKKIYGSVVFKIPGWIS